MEQELIEQALKYVDDPQFAESPPGAFVEAMRLRGSSLEFLKAAWSLFKEKRVSITPAEVADHMKG